MRNFPLLLLGLTVLVTTSIYIAQNFNQLAKRSDDMGAKYCAVISNSREKINGKNWIQNDCTDNSVKFFFIYYKRDGEGQEGYEIDRSTKCLRYKEKELYDDEPAGYYFGDFLGMTCV